MISGVPGYSSHVQAGGLADSISEREAEAQKDETSGGGLSDIVQSFADAGEEAGLEDVADSAEEPLTESSATYAEWHTSEPLVVDNADLWTDREESELAERADELSREYGIVLVLVSTLDTDGKSTMEYADDYFDYHPYGEDGILVLFDMKNKEVFISTTGKGIQLLNDARIESVLDEIFANDNMADGKYYEAALGFLDGTEVYLKSGPARSGHDDVKRVKKLTFAEIGTALVLSGLIGLVFFRTNASRYKKKKQSPFFDTANAATEYSFINDHFLNKSVTSVVRSSSSSSSSGGGRTSTRSSSSGRSHGGGGRKF